MPLDAAHQQLSGERAAAAVLQGVAERVDRGRLAHDAVVDQLLAALQFLDHAHRTVDCRAFLVRGEEQGDGAGVLRPLGNEDFGSDHKGRDR